MTPTFESLFLAGFAVHHNLTGSAAHWLGGYDPQLLLTDQRGKLKRWADEHSGLFASGGYVGNRVIDTLYPYQRDAMLSFERSGNEFFIPRGTGRFRSPEPEYQDMPGVRRARISRVVTPHVHTRVEIINVDYADIEKRILAGLAGKRSVLNQIALMGRYREADIEARMMEIMLGVAIKQTPREERISRLVMSLDPRQRKRGKRLRRQSRGFTDTARYMKD